MSLVNVIRLVCGDTSSVMLPFVCQERQVLCGRVVASFCPVGKYLFLPGDVTSCRSFRMRCFWLTEENKKKPSDRLCKTSYVGAVHKQA